MSHPDEADPAPLDAVARAELRRRTWTLEPLETRAPNPTPQPDSAEMLENWRRLEQLRRAASALRGEVYPERSTPSSDAHGPEASSVVDLVDDFIDLLRCFEAAGVEYLLVGGYALNAYGVVRATEDLDVFVNPDEDNLRRVLTAMDAFGTPPGLTLAALRPGDTPPTGFRFGRRPVSVDLLTSVMGITYDEARTDRTHVLVRDLRVPVVGREALRRNKAAVGRLKDLADLEDLGEG